MALLLKRVASPGSQNLPAMGFLVVGDRDAALRTMRAVAMIAGGSAEVLTLAALRGRVLSAAGLPEARPPSAVAVRLGLREATDGASTPALAASRQSPGFLPALERAMAELWRAKVPATTCAARAPSAIADDVSTLYSVVETFPSAETGRWAVVDAVSLLTEFPPVSVVGFDDLSPADWALLRNLGRVTAVEVVMPYQERRRAHEARHERQKTWAAMADRTEEVTAPDTEKHPSLAAIADVLFEDVAHPDLGDAPVRLIGAAGTRGMHRVALQEVLRAHDEGIALGDCAIVVPRLAEARDDLDRLCADWGVPARRVTRRRVLETPLGLALVSLLRLGEMDPDSPGALDALLGWLRTPYSGAYPAEVDAFEKDARRAGLDERRELIGRWEGEAIAPARRLVAAARAGVREQLQALIDVGWQALQRASGGDEPPTHADVLDRAALGVLMGASADDPSDEEPLEASRGPLPQGELGQLLADLTVRDERGPYEGLALLDYASVRGRRFTLVVLCGLDGDGYPSRPAPDPFLSDLRPALAEHLPPRAPGTSESRLRYWHAVSAAEARIALVRRVVDDDGREVAPSPYWVETCRVIGRSAEELDVRMSATGELIQEGETPPTEREALRHLAVTGHTADGPLADAVGRRTRSLGVPTATFDDVGEISVTTLETFLRCPYGWLIDRYVSPQPIENEFDVAAEGSFIHEVVERVYRSLHGEGVGACTAATLDRYIGRLDEVLPEVEKARRPRRAGPMYDAFVRRVGVYLRLMLRGEAALGLRIPPARFEHAVKDPDILELTPPMLLTGTADRLDISESGDVVVVDYKRTRGSFKAAAEVTERLQLPLYGHLTARDLVTQGLGGARSAGGFYIGILSGERSGAVADDVLYADALPAKHRLPPGDWEKAIDEAVSAARTAAADLRGGRLDGPPSDGCPPWCGCGALWR